MSERGDGDSFGGKGGALLVRQCEGRKARPSELHRGKNTRGMRVHGGE